MNTNLLDEQTPESDLKSLALGVAGVNMGFGYSKLVLDGLEATFMSAMTPLNRGIEGIGQRKADPLNIVRAEDGNIYEVGVEGILNSTDEPLKIMSRDWGRSLQYRMRDERSPEPHGCNGKAPLGDLHRPGCRPLR